MAHENTFPPSTPCWNDLSTIHKNTLPPRASFFPYPDPSSALSYDLSKSLSHSLSGTWAFHLSNDPFSAPQDFHRQDYDISKWGTIEVPGMWQLQGYGRGPQYTNVNYPFPVDPPNVPWEGNETGSYVREFKLPEEWSERGHQLRLRFEGVDSAFSVWINGVFVGYSQGSRNPSEFDITKLVHFNWEGKGENRIAVRVHQWCDGSWIEDQDQWWLSGIFRDVNLVAFPKIHLQDFQVQTLLDNDYRDAILSVDINLCQETEISAQLLDASHKVIFQQSSQSKDSQVSFRWQIKTPYKWTAEAPYLYHLVLSAPGSSVAQRIGFRNVELKDGLLLVNGHRIVFRGVNRHEHHPLSGRTIPYEFLKRDLLLMKTHNINAIRTSHQPNDPRLYDLADELGLWIIDEADLECHGFSSVEEEALPAEQKRLSYEERKKIVYHRAARWTSDNPDWKEAYLDRAKQLVMRDKNHASIVMWSLGNEAFYGRNFKTMYQWIKSYDPTRLVHYEGDVEAESADVFSQMYPPVADIIEFATKDNPWEKPLILCEFVHAMGNGPGSIKEYLDAFYKYPRLQGGFAWEWANHGLRTKDKQTGQVFYAYGGDFGEQVHDGNFVMDGLCFSEHMPTPGLIEYKKAIEPVQVLGGDSHRVRIVNRHDFLTLDHLKCEWSIVGNGFEIPGSEILVPEGIQPGHEAELLVNKVSPSDWEGKNESYLQVVFTLKDATSWALAGHEIAWGQIQLQPPQSHTTSQSPLQESPKLVQDSSTTLSITTNTTSWKFEMVSGTLVSWVKSSKELIYSPPMIDFYRPLTDNDRPADGIEWLEKRLNQTREYTRSVTWKSDPSNSSVIITVIKRIAPPVLEWSVDIGITYTFNSSGTIHIQIKGQPQGINLPTTFARIGLTFSLHSSTADTATWFGRGPGESYIDKKMSQRFGTWSLPIDDLFTDYEFPQESGNRTDVRHVAFHTQDSEKVGLVAKFGAQEGCSFSASRYRCEDVDKARHPHELRRMRREDEIVVRLDWRHHGLGTGSCGPGVLEQYVLRAEAFEFDVMLE